MIARLRSVLACGAAKSAWLRPLHGRAVAADHRREIRAVAAGQRRYQEDLTGDVTTSFLLRRNVHRLEKGLIMQPRRAEFAADYIGETVDLFLRILAGENYDDEERRWAGDVLSAYFDAVVADDRRISDAKNRFFAAHNQFDKSRPAVPFKRDLSIHPVSPESFLELTRKRRSVRWFEPRLVDRAIVDAALEAAAQSPSACNRQPFHFRLFDRPGRPAEIASLTLGTRGFEHQIPGIAVIVGRLRAYPMSRDRHAIYIDGALAAMSFMLALECRGVATCPINWPDQEPNESRMRAALGLEDDERVVMLVAYGWPHPDGLVPYSAKKGLAELRRYEDDPK